MKFFGVNERSLPKLRTLWTIMKGHLDDTLVYLLLIFAGVSFGASFWSDVKYSWLEGISIVVAVGFMTILAAICDYAKEQQFNTLRKELMKEKSTVIRGQYGGMQQVFNSNIVVGDLISLTAGDRVPADCLLIEECDMMVNEELYFPELTDFVEK